jgi:hypothetical protein
MRTRIHLLVLTALCLPYVVQAGSGQRTGTNGASELLIPVGTRDMAMAGSTVAAATGIDALFWNPAGSAHVLRDVTLYASHMAYIADIAMDCGALSVSIADFGVVSLDLKVLSIGDIPVTTTQYPDGTGNTFRPQFFTMGLTYARQLTDRISVGVTGTLITERMAEVSANGVSFNLGLTYSGFVGVPGLAFGVAVKNVGPQMKFDGPGLSLDAVAGGLQRGTMLYNVEAAGFELPSTFELGFAYRTDIIEENTLLLASSFENNNFADDEYKFGLEYGFRDLLFLRIGYDYQPPKSSDRENIFGLTFGAGVHMIVGSVDFTFDYAFRSAQFFDNNHVFSLKLGM